MILDCLQPRITLDLSGLVFHLNNFVDLIQIMSIKDKINDLFFQDHGLLLYKIDVSRF
jgi:hypothetical protein